MREDKKTFAIYSILRVLVILSMVRQFFLQNYEGVAICLLSLALLLLPSFAEQKFRIKIPALFKGCIFAFIFAAEILGELNHFYTAIPGWDTILHTINGFLCAAAGFSLVDLLNRNSEHVRLSPFYMALTAFCFSMTVGVMWEFLECGADLFFAQDMQKDFIVQKFQSVTLDPTGSQIAVAVRDITDTVIHTLSGETYTIEGGYLDIGILDTMKDLLVNFIGAVVFCTFGYLYVRNETTHPRSGRLVEGLRLRPDDTPETTDTVEPEQTETRNARKKKGKKQS